MRGCYSEEKAVFRIRIRKFLGLPDPDLLVREVRIRIRILPSGRSLTKRVESGSGSRSIRHSWYQNYTGFYAECKSVEIIGKVYPEKVICKKLLPVSITA
jgi:hypothetical protein